MKIIGDLIVADNGRDIFRGQARADWKLVPKAKRKYPGEAKAAGLWLYRRSIY